MPSTFSKTDLEFLGYEEARLVPLADEVGFDIYETKARAGLETLDHRFFYLKSDCTVDNIAAAAKHIQRGQSAYVVYPRSIKVTKQTIQNRFGKEAKLYEQEELVWSRLKALFSDYLASLATGVAAEPFYIPPRKEKADAQHRLDDELLDYLQGKGDIKPGQLAVVCAPAAVGKTTLSRHLLRQLVSGVEKYRIIPTYVESSHWGRLQLESADDLWDIIRNSLATFSSTLSLRRELFEYALRQGYICFIFDGFDELCGHRSAQFNPNDVLEDLAKIAEKSEARIVLTTRTLYWQAEITESPSNVHVLELAPFNTQQAKGYFQLFFRKDQRKQQRAIDLYGAVVEGSYRPKTKGGARAQFVNLPVCVVMVAQFVEADGNELKAQRPGRLLEEILEAVCTREVARKKLVTSAKDQLLAFEAVSIEEDATPNPEFDLSLLEAAGIQTTDIQKLIDHPLLTRATGSSYKFNYEFLAPFFRATFLERFISISATATGNDAWKLMARESNGKGFILEHLVSLLPHDCIGLLAERYSSVPQAQREARSFLFHLADLILSDDPSFVTAQERTRQLFQVVGAQEQDGRIFVQSFYVQGPLEDLNLQYFTFQHCTFRDVAFTKTLANSTTSFVRCSFSGAISIPTSKRGWSEVVLEGCTFVPPSNLTWESIVAGAGGSRDQNVRDALKLALDKFWHHGRLRGSISKGSWGRGLLSHTRYAAPVLDAMLRLGLIREIEISGVAEGGYAFDRNSIPDLQRFMDNRQPTGKIKLVYDRLMTQ